MFSVLKRSFSTANDKFTKIGRQNVKSTVKLDYLVFNPKQNNSINAPILAYHGLYASKHLWTPVADSIANATNRQFCGVDLRNHGRSERTTIERSYVPLMALDMKQFMHEHNIGKGVLLGHSFGGRVMMQIAFDYPEMVEKLIVVDMGFNMPTIKMSFQYMLNKLLRRYIKQVDPQLNLEDGKDQLQKLMSQKFKDQFFVEVTCNTLEKVNGKFQYSFNIDVLYESLWKGRLSHLDATNPYNGQCLFLYANTGIVVEEDFICIQTVFPNVKFEHINTGHYGMVENPTLFSKVVSKFINS